MRGSKTKRHSGVVFRADDGRRRSLRVPLLWLGAAAFIGYPVLRDSTSDKMQRNRYGSDQFSCECDYGAGACTNEAGAWVGPWYAVDAADRKADDPGRGACRSSSGGHAGHGYAYSGASTGEQEAYRGPNGVEAGYRGGFGDTGRVRAAGS